MTGDAGEYQDFTGDPPWLARHQAAVEAFDLAAALKDDNLLVDGIVAANRVIAEWSRDLIGESDVEAVLAAMRHLGVRLIGGQAGDR